VSLFGLFEKRVNLENPAVSLSDPSLLAWLSGPPTDSGVPVNEMTAMQFSAVARCVSLISGLGGAMPIMVADAKTKHRVDHPLVATPHPDMTAVEFWRLTYVARALWGNFYAQKIRKRMSGDVQYLMPIAPNQVAPKRGPVTSSNPSGKVFEITENTGGTRIMTSRDIFHLPGLGYDGIAGVSPVRMAAQAIGLALGAERYAAKLFGSGNLMNGILQTDQKLTQQQAESLQDRWTQKMSGLQRAHQAAVLDAGLHFQSLTMPNDDAQLLESRRFELTEIGRWYGVPPFLMFDHEKSTTWGSGLEQQALGFVKFDLHPTWLGPTEQRITKELLPAGLEARYDLTDLLRGDSISRAEFYRVMREVGAYSANDIRRNEGMPDIDGGDEYLKPAAMGTTEDAPLGTDKVMGGASLGPSDSSTS
jgi:HK97 family phage portal protein